MKTYSKLVSYTLQATKKFREYHDQDVEERKNKSGNTLLHTNLAWADERHKWDNGSERTSQAHRLWRGPFE